MACSGKGSSSSGSGSYSGAGSGLAGAYGNSAAGGYAGKGNRGYGLSRGIYGNGGIYDGTGTGYGKREGIPNGLGNGIPKVGDFYFNMPRFRESYLKRRDSRINAQDSYSIKQMLASVNLLYSQHELERKRNDLEKIMKPCPYCGRDKLICGCMN